MDSFCVKSPTDLKRLNISELNDYCAYVRSRIISVVETNGGHLASNLGAVELTVALHYVFDCPTDKFVFDVGHQAYTHKIITGRDGMFDGLRRNGGISGFPQPEESEADCFVSGHSSTSLSVALGLAEGARKSGATGKTVAVIGDGALTGGQAYEALNAIGAEQLPILIVLNDNNMSISKNVGAISKYLTRLRVSKKYSKLKTEIKRSLSTLPVVGDGALTLIEKGKSFLKRVVLSNKMFEDMGISYYGPFDGHDLRELTDVFSQVKSKSGPVLVHVITDKGHGLKSAVCDPEHSHGISSVGARKGKDFSSDLGEFLCEAAERDRRIMAVTAAMSIGTGLENFSARFPDKFKDVGIAEEHAVTYCAALASAGLKPYFCVYSTFLQRSFDQLLHDVCIGKHPVTLCIDRAGAVGADGVTHQGVFDLSYLLPLPNMTVVCPTDGDELKSMLDFSLTFDAPLAIRYPKSYSVRRDHAPVEYGRWEYMLKNAKSKAYVLCAGGRALDAAFEAAQDIAVNIINARFVKPLDDDLLKSINAAGNVVVTVEDNMAAGGFGSAVLARLNALGLKAKIVNIAHGDAFIFNRDVQDSLVQSGICAQNIIRTLKALE